MVYTIRYSTARGFKKEVQAVKNAGYDKQFKEKIEKIIKIRPLSGKPLSLELAGLFRVKLLKDWRIIYSVIPETKHVLIIAVRPRSIAYDDPDELNKRREN